MHKELHILCMAVNERVPAVRAEVPSGGLYLYCGRVPRASNVHEAGQEQLFILLGNSLKHQQDITVATGSMWHSQIEGCAFCTPTGW